MFKKLRPRLSIILLIVALAVGYNYLNSHRRLLTQLKHTPLDVSLLVLALYCVMFGVLVLVLSASLALCKLRIGQRENGLLNAHSLFINFFVPGQGGPAYRGLQLYKRHHLRIKNYLIITLLYYATYAVINIGLMFGGVRPWWQTGLAVLMVGVISWAVIKWYLRRNQLSKNSLNLSPGGVLFLALVTFLQAVVQMLIYAVELHSANGHIKFSQVITYTGAANLALFASLTPGAIGIRESFLVFTEHLHHISSANIVVANVIDRSVYLVFLGLLILVTGGWHLKNKAPSDELVSKKKL